MPRSTVAVVGASPRNFWTNCAITNLRHFDPELAVVPVTPNHETVGDLPAVASVEQLEGTPRAAVIAIRREASVEAVRTLTAKGTPDIVLVSDGFGERGDELGRALQAELVDIVSGTGTRLWGPNCVGFADFTEGVCAIAEPVWLDTVPGPLSIVSQSGALVSALLAAAREENLGVDFCVSTGNGAVFGVPQALELALRRPTTRIVGVYLEGVSAEALPAFVHALETAQELGKQVVVLKSGVSDRGRRAVMSHTASIAGTDTVFAELLRQYGVLRADGMDELMRLVTLSLLGVGAGRPRAVAVLGGSGGAAALCSDLAEKHGVELAVFADRTVSRIRELAGPGSFIDNPLDVIGVKRREGDESINGTVFQDPNSGLVLMPWSVQFPSERPEQAVHTWNWNDLAQLSARHQVPLVITSMAPLPSTEFSRDYQQRNPHVAVVQNLALTFAALAKLFPAVGGQAAAHAAPAAVEGRVLSEADSRELVEAAGVPAVRGVRVPRGADPAELAAELRPPFAVKVIAPVSHKMRIGGVVLGVSSVGELATAVKQVEDAVVDAGLPASAVEGCLVEEMVFGREVLVGLNTDVALGRYVVVGLGGSATELANRSTTRRLPLRPGDVDDLLAGVGIGSHARLARLVEDLCAAFTDGSLAGYETVEINPVIVTADECWAADAVVTEAAPE